MICLRRRLLPAYGPAEKVLVETERLTKQEVRVRRDLDRGATLKEMLMKYGHV